MSSPKEDRSQSTPPPGIRYVEAFSSGCTFSREVGEGEWENTPTESKADAKWEHSIHEVRGPIVSLYPSLRLRTNRNRIRARVPLFMSPYPRSALMRSPVILRNQSQKHYSPSRCPQCQDAAFLHHLCKSVLVSGWIRKMMRMTVFRSHHHQPTRGFRRSASSYQFRMS